MGRRPAGRTATGRRARVPRRATSDDGPATSPAAHLAAFDARDPAARVAGGAARGRQPDRRHRRRRHGVRRGQRRHRDRGRPRATETSSGSSRSTPSSSPRSPSPTARCSWGCRAIATVSRRSWRSTPPTGEERWRHEPSVRLDRRLGRLGRRRLVLRDLHRLVGDLGRGRRPRRRRGAVEHAGSTPPST